MLALLGIWAAATLAPAEAQADKKLAKKMLKEANKLLKEGEVDSAIERLTSAWEVVPTPKIGKALVSAWEKKGNTVAAAKFVDNIVASKKPKKLVKWAKKKKKAFAKTLKKLDAEKAAADAAAAKEAEAAEAKQAKQDAENRRLAEEEAKARAAARAKQKVRESAAPAPAAAAPAKAEKQAKPEKKEEAKPEAPKTAEAAPADPDFDEDMESTYVPPPDPTWTFFGYTAAGVAVAALGAGTFFLIRKNSRQSEANDCAKDADITGGKCAQATYENLTDEMDGAFTLELISWATAAVAAGASVALFTFAPPAELTSATGLPELPPIQLLLTPSGGFLQGRF